MSAAHPVTCGMSDVIREGMRSSISRDIGTDVIAIDYLDGDMWVLTDYRTTVASGRFRCWHVADAGRSSEVAL